MPSQIDDLCLGKLGERPHREEKPHFREGGGSAVENWNPVAVPAGGVRQVEQRLCALSPVAKNGVFTRIFSVLSGDTGLEWAFADCTAVKAHTKTPKAQNCAVLGPPDASVKGCPAESGRLPTPLHTWSSSGSFRARRTFRVP